MWSGDGSGDGSLDEVIRNGLRQREKCSEVSEAGDFDKTGLQGDGLAAVSKGETVMVSIPVLPVE